MPENPASYRVVRTKSYLFNKAPFILRVRGVISRKIAVVTGGKYRGNRRRRTGILFICHCEGECF
ncbi:hypothetical protein EI015_18485 [Escherichia coli]|nr:hypothetical protein [Escherichia coli]MQL04172.1 hypothetical protein [Escherichia coli]